LSTINLKIFGPGVLSWPELLRASLVFVLCVSPSLAELMGVLPSPT